MQIKPLSQTYYTSSDVPNRYKYNGKELFEDLQWLNYGARFYDAAVGRFWTRDNYSEKYAWMSPYQYAGNSPVVNIDVNGDSINFSSALINNEEVVKKIINDLRYITGLSLYLDQSGMLLYKTENDDGKSKVVIATDDEGAKQGSRVARRMLIKVVNNKKTVFVFSNNNISSKGGGVQININSNQIEMFINGTSDDLNSMTMGYGMSFLHELGHTKIGGKKHDPQLISLSDGRQGVIFGRLGSNVRKMNRIRRQLGDSFGKRYSYGAKALEQNRYIPFSYRSLIILENNHIPNRSYIKF